MIMGLGLWSKKYGVKGPYLVTGVTTFVIMVRIYKTLSRVVKVEQHSDGLNLLIKSDRQPKI